MIVFVPTRDMFNFEINLLLR